MAEGISILTLNLIIISGLSVTLERSLFSQLVSGQLAEGVIPMPQVRRISESIDKYVNGVLTAANVPADVRTNAIGAFLPEAPDWAEPLAEVMWRMTRSAIQVRSLPRQIDLLIQERVAREPEVAERAARRLGLERPETARLRNPLTAFLRGCNASPTVVDEALTAAVPLESLFKEATTAISGQMSLYPEPLPTGGDASAIPEPNE